MSAQATPRTTGPAAATAGSPAVGLPLNRVDGPQKVCGVATFAAEFKPQGLTHGVLVLSTIPSGRVAGFDLAAAQATPGVLKVLTPQNAPRLPQGGKAAGAPPAGRALSLLQDDRVHYNGQPIALVVADTLEHASAAARLIVPRYVASSAVLSFDKAKRTPRKPEKVQSEGADTVRGSLTEGWQAGATRLEAIYTTPIEHHNPMEPHATVAAWNGDALTLYDSTQYVSGVKNAVAKTLGIAPEKVTVTCPFVGGGFGCKGSAWSHVLLAAMAAREVGRPVKVVLDRTQMFGPVGHRPRTEQTLRLAAHEDGQLALLQHNSLSETSMLEDWVEPAALAARMLYTSTHQGSSHRLARMHVATPTFMRAPGESSGSFALESAMDELSYALKMDPVELRLRNYAERDPGKNLPFSSKALRACYQQGAQRIGWARRHAVPATQHEGHWRVGLGMATATYPTNRSPAEASVRVTADGTALVQSGTQDLGTGTYTVMTQVAADALGLPMSQVRFELGDSRMPKAPVSGGSQSAASVSGAVQQACLAARTKLIQQAVGDAHSPLHGLAPDAVLVADGRVQAAGDARRSEPVAELLKRNGGMPVEATGSAQPGDEKKQYSMHAFGAVFAQVRVDAQLGVVQVPRLVGAYGVGRVLNAKTAHSQLMGGMVWGLGMALFEETQRDGRSGRYVNTNLAQYHMPANADVGAIEVIVVPEDDPHINLLGVKGIGEIGIVGVAAAIANAVYNATGKRVRDLPITLDKLLT